MSNKKNKYDLTAQQDKLTELYVHKYLCNPKYKADCIREAFNPSSDDVTWTMASDYFSMPKILLAIEKKKRYSIHFDTPEVIYADIMEARDIAKNEATKRAYDELRIKIKQMIVEKQEIKNTDIDFTEQAEKVLKQVQREYDRLQNEESAQNGVSPVTGDAQNDTETRQNTLTSDTQDIPIIGTINSPNGLVTIHAQDSPQSSKDGSKRVTTWQGRVRAERSMLSGKAEEKEGGGDVNGGSPKGVDDGV